MLDYLFFRYALAAILLMAVASAVIGTYIVSRRLVSLSGGITHASFGGLGVGYYLGISPVAVAAAFAVAAGLGVQWLGSSRKVRDDSAVAVVWAVGMAIGVIFVFMTPGYVPELTAFLFGNILTVGLTDIAVYAIYTAALLLYLALRFRVVVSCAFDPAFSRVIGLPVAAVNSVMMIFTAVGIVLTIKMAGIMLLMSMIALPQLTAERFCNRFLTIMGASAAIAVASCMAGLWLGVWVDVPCSALIVVVMSAVYLASWGISEAAKAIKRR
ncbi:MAG: metal ABC transporter permease [Clostridium sp.]|nr:metal ABC transporter permease [Clostridium sp.]